LTCKDIRALFSEYYDGYAPGEDAPGEITSAEIAAHLHECAACATAYKEYAKLLDDVRTIPMPEIPSGFHESLMEYVEANKERPKYSSISQPKRKLSLFHTIPPFAMVAASLIFALIYSGAFVRQSVSVTEDYYPFTQVETTIGITPSAGGLPYPMSPRGPLPEGDPIPIAPAVGLIEPFPEYFPQEEEQPEQRRTNNIVFAAIAGILLAGGLGSFAFSITRMRR